ncbi:hypothetical protein F4678DRAFT_464980 [Xylaria arbuscula]|nr:hypothetical protein F4678DRAFT_464980 [Xylaria arbuscula]
MPLHPYWVYAIEAAKGLEMQLYVLSLAAIASVEGPMLRQSSNPRNLLHIVHQQWMHRDSDHIGQLNTLHAYLMVSTREVIDTRVWCNHHLLDHGVLEQIVNIRRQLIKGFKLRHQDQPEWMNTPNYDETTPPKIREALAHGLFFNTAMRVKPGEHVLKIHENQDVLIHIN